MKILSLCLSLLKFFYNNLFILINYIFIKDYHHDDGIRDYHEGMKIANIHFGNETEEEFANKIKSGEYLKKDIIISVSFLLMLILFAIGVYFSKIISHTFREIYFTLIIVFIIYSIPFLIMKTIYHIEIYKRYKEKGNIE